MVIDKTVYATLKQTLGLGTSKIYVALNNIRTQYYIKYDSDKIEFFYRTREEAIEVTLEDIVEKEAILDLTRSAIVAFRYDANYSIIDIITDDFLYLEKTIKMNMDILELVSPITGASLNPNRYAISKDRLTRIYLAHYMKVLASYVRYGMTRKSNTQIYNRLRHFTPVVPLNDEIMTFIKDYNAVLPISLSGLIAKLEPFKVDSDLFLWATYKELAEYFNLPQKKFNMLTIFNLFSAHFINTQVYLLNVNIEGAPKLLSEDMYTTAVKEYPKLADIYQRAEYVTLVLNEINGVNEKAGLSKLNRADLKTLNIV